MKDRASASQTPNAQHAFCLTRPPGHHAEYARANGFCFFNYAFDAARFIIEQQAQRDTGQDTRVAIIDFDVHHGNGTEDLVRRYYIEHSKKKSSASQSQRKPIAYFSSFENGIFPALSYDPQTAKGCDVSDHAIYLFPFDQNHSSTDMRTLYEREVIPALENYAPDFIILSAGFDAHRDDPLSSARWDEEDYTFITRAMMALNAPILSVLEGGYNLEALENCVCAHLDALIG